MCSLYYLVMTFLNRIFTKLKGEVEGLNIPWWLKPWFRMAQRSQEMLGSATDPTFLRLTLLCAEHRNHGKASIRGVQRNARSSQPSRMEIHLLVWLPPLQTEHLKGRGWGLGLTPLLSPRAGRRPGQALGREREKSVPWPTSPRFFNFRHWGFYFWWLSFYFWKFPLVLFQSIGFESLGLILPWEFFIFISYLYFKTYWYSFPDCPVMLILEEAYSPFPASSDLEGQGGSYPTFPG